MSEKPVKDYDKFMLRLPEGMRGAIAERAKKNSRSMNSEIVQILEDALASNSSADIHFSEAEVAELTGISVEAINELTNALKQSTDTINKLKATLIHSHKG